MTVYLKRGVMILLFAFLPTLAHAMIVFDPDVFARLGEEMRLLQSQADDVHRELAAIKQLGSSQYQWSNAQGLINQLGSVVNQANSIAYSAEHLENEFQQHFPGYQASANYNEQYQKITTSTLNTINGILQTVGQSANDFQNENRRLAFLQAQAQNAQGQTQAIQAAAQIASEQVSQLQLLRQTLMAQTNAQTVYYAATIQNEASAKAKFDAVIKAGSTDVPAYGASGHTLNLPKH